MCSTDPLPLSWRAPRGLFSCSAFVEMVMERRRHTSTASTGNSCVAALGTRKREAARKGPRAGERASISSPPVRPAARTTRGVAGGGDDGAKKQNNTTSRYSLNRHKAALMGCRMYSTHSALTTGVPRSALRIFVAAIERSCAPARHVLSAEMAPQR